MEYQVIAFSGELVYEKNGTRVFPPPGKKTLSNTQVPHQQFNLSSLVKPLAGAAGNHCPCWLTITPMPSSKTPNPPALYRFPLESLRSVICKWILEGTALLILRRGQGARQAAAGINEMAREIDPLGEEKIIIKGVQVDNLKRFVEVLQLLLKGQWKGRETLQKGQQQPHSEGKENPPPSAAKSKWDLPPEIETFTKERLEIAQKAQTSGSGQPANKMKLRELTPSDSYSSEETTKRKMLPKDLLQVTSAGPRYHLLLNRLVMPKIQKYLSSKEIENFSLTNKQMYNFMCGMRKTLDLSKFSEVPEIHLIKLLTKYTGIEKLITGKLQGFKPDLEKLKHLRLPQLKHLDCSKMVIFNDNTVNFYRQLAPSIKELIVPFFGLTSHSILTLKDQYKSLEVFKAVHTGKYLKSSGVANPNLSVKALVEFVQALTKLREFEVFSSDADLFQAFGATKTTFSLVSLVCDHLILGSRDSIDKMSAICNLFPGLTHLTLGDLHLQGSPAPLPLPSLPTQSTLDLLTKLVTLPSTPNPSQTSQPLTSLPTQGLTFLGLGNWIEPAHLALLSTLPAPTSRLATLRSLQLSSPLIRDNDLSPLLGTLHRLRRVDLNGCTLLNGLWACACPPTVREIVVSMGEGGASQLRQIVLDKQMTHCAIINLI